MSACPSHSRTSLEGVDLREERPSAVAEGVEADATELRLGERRVEPLAEIPLVEVVAELVGEEEVVPRSRVGIPRTEGQERPRPRRDIRHRPGALRERHRVRRKVAGRAWERKACARLAPSAWEEKTSNQRTVL